MKLLKVMLPMIMLPTMTLLRMVLPPEDSPCNNSPNNDAPNYEVPINETPENSNNYNDTGDGNSAEYLYSFRFNGKIINGPNNFVITIFSGRDNLDIGQIKQNYP